MVGEAGVNGASYPPGVVDWSYGTNAPVKVTTFGGGGRTYTESGYSSLATLTGWGGGIIIIIIVIIIFSSITHKEHRLLHWVHLDYL